MDLIYLDFSIAFNKVDQGILLTKMKSLGIDGLTGRWVARFPENRTQAVKIDYQRSNCKPVISGIPQETGIDHSIEAIQRALQKRVSGSEDLTYSQRLSKYNLLSLKWQQEFSYIMWLLGIINQTNKHFFLLGL